MNNFILKITVIPLLPFHIIASRKLTVTALTVLLFLCLPLHTAFAKEPDGLAGYIEIALEQNHEINAAYATWQAAKEKIRQAGTLPDPKLGAEYFLEPIETRTGPQEAAISLSQSIPWPGKLSLQKKEKEYQTAIAREKYYITRLLVVRKVKEAFVEFGYLEKAQQVTDHILELMQYLEGVVRTNYTSGKAAYADVLKVQIEIDKLLNKQQTLAENKTPVISLLNSLLGAERNTPRTTPVSLPAVNLTTADEEIYMLSRQNSPQVAVVEQTLNKTKTSLKIADQGFYPDLNISVKNIFTGEAEFGDPPDSGNDPLVAGVTVTIPLFYGKRNGAIAEKQSLVQAARAMHQQTLTDIDAKIEMILFRYQKANRLQNLYKNNLIPKVRQELDVALEAFQGGQSSILELIDAEKNWLTFELSLVRAQADMAIQVARLEELTGTTLVDWNQIL